MKVLIGRHCFSRVVALVVVSLVVVARGWEFSIRGM